MDAHKWMVPTDDDINANPSCIARRVADTKTYHHDIGLFANTNWYRLNREAIPIELRSKGYDSYNFEDKFALEYKAGGAAASSIGNLEFDHVSTLMPPENLIKFTTWKDDMKNDKTWNQVNNFKWTQDGRSSTCWASIFEKDPWVSLKLTSYQQIHKVVVDGLFNGEQADKTLEGAQIWVTGSAEAEERMSQIEKDSRKAQTGAKMSPPKVLEGDPDAKLCNGAISLKPGLPTTVICDAKPWGNEIIVTYERSTAETPRRRLILCMVWPYRYDEEFHGMMNRKR
jgi:hypothetical protein